jgi:RNA polymerase sigma factor (sigma-70 family)
MSMSTAVHTTDPGSQIGSASIPAAAMKVPRLNATLLRTQSDARLTRLAAGGYEGAFEELVRRYRGPLQGYARRFVRPASAEDVVQQALIDLWARLAAGEQIREVRPWLYRVVHNAALNTIRRSDYRSEQLPEIVASDSPHAAFERSVAVREALAGVAALPEQQRAAMVHNAVNGHSRGQIAGFMGVSEGAVGQMLHRARVSVRAAMSAVVPWPLVAWATGIRRGGGSTTARVLGTAGAGGGPAGLLVKGGATLAVIAAATATPFVVKHVGAQPGSRAAGSAPHAALAADAGTVDLRAAQLPALLSASSPTIPRALLGTRSGHAPSSSSAGSVAGAAKGETAPAAGDGAEAPTQPEPPPAPAEAAPPGEKAHLAEAPAEAPPAAESPEAPAEAAPPGAPEVPPAEPAAAPPAEAATPAPAGP